MRPIGVRIDRATTFRNWALRRVAPARSFFSPTNRSKVEQEMPLTDLHPGEAIDSEFPSVHVQSVLYNLPLEKISRALEYLDNACQVAERSQAVRRVTVAYGDCSPKPTISPTELDTLRKTFLRLAAIDYTFFGANLGSAAGHNRLLEHASADFVMILNPDVLVAPNLFIELLAALALPPPGRPGQDRHGLSPGQQPRRHRNGAARRTELPNQRAIPGGVQSRRGLRSSA
jgi:hypothetical protein